MQAADYYMEKENLFILEEDQKLRLVCNYRCIIVIYIICVVKQLKMCNINFWDIFDFMYFYILTIA